MCCYILLDADGCLRKASGRDPNPTPPEAVVVRAAHRLAATGKVEIALTTGQPKDNAILTEEQMGGFKFSRLFVDNAGLMLCGGYQQSLVPEEEQASLVAISQGLTDLLVGAKLAVFDDREVLAEKNYFFKGPTTYAMGHWAVKWFLSRHPAAARNLRVQWNRIDHSMNLMPRSSSKELAVKWFERGGAEVAVAAGDGMADLVMMEKARFAIVTSNTGTPNRKLVEAVTVQREPGTYYVASRPHGLGLVDGLHQAAARGFLPPF